jgi:transcriptional regulator with XRE-family HTH domain
MKAYGWFKEELERARGTFEYKLAGLELEVTERILQVMQEQGITRSELARRLGVSKAAVSKLLNDGSNMTLKRLLAVAEALNHDLRINLAPSGHKVEEEFIYYSAAPRLHGPQFRIEGQNGADDYSIVEELTAHAIHSC